MTSPSVMPASRKLVSLHVSPWSERARWALDHHSLAYEKVEHFPILGERRLRRLVGPDKPRATVPVLVDGDRVLSDSWDIVLYADSVGSAPRLVPSEREADVRQWARRADDAMQGGRALILGAMLQSPGALDESSPPFLPAWVRPGLRPIARRTVSAFARKYELELDDPGKHEEPMRRALDALREGLRGSSPYLLGSFGYADIAMATVIQGVSPVADRFLRLRPATRAVWTRAALATEYADLVKWRDELYERHRRATTAAAGS
jgi:glutathione S-transferase